MLKKYLRKIDMMKMLGRLLGAFLAIVLFTFVTPLQMAYATATPPARTISFYMDTTNPAVLGIIGYNQGCTLGTHDKNTAGMQDNLVILLFGKPAYSKNTYGTFDWTAHGSGQVFVTTAQIAAAVERFGAGYWDCTGSDTTSQVFVAAGTSNEAGGVTTVTEYAHGRAWGQMTTSINLWISSHGYSTQIKVRAASDMELGFNDPASTRAWVDGYSDATNTSLALYDVGDAAGCPYAGAPKTTCGTRVDDGWNSENVWYIASAHVQSYPVPEIYNTGGVNAGQWYYLSLYAYTKHSKAMWFPAALTQAHACQQNGGCSGVDNTPAQGWTQLWNAINADSHTAQSYLRWSTDMIWH